MSSAGSRLVTRKNRPAATWRMALLRLGGRGRCAAGSRRLHRCCGRPRSPEPRALSSRNRASNGGRAYFRSMGSTSQSGDLGRSPGPGATDRGSRLLRLVVDSMGVLLEDAVAFGTRRLLQLEHRLWVEKVVFTPRIASRLPLKGAVCAGSPAPARRCGSGGASAAIPSAEIPAAGSRCP